MFYQINDMNFTFQGAAKTMKDTIITTYLCKVLPEVNRALIDQFKMGENLNEVIIIDVRILSVSKIDLSQGG